MRDTKTGRSASFRIVTLEREYGCGAAGIAEKLATRLGWTLWDQRLTQEIARLAHSEKSAVEKREERRDPLYYRLFKSFALGSYEGSPGVPVETLDAGLFGFLEGTTDAAFGINQTGRESFSGTGRPDGCLGIPLLRSSHEIAIICTSASRL